MTGHGMGRVQRTGLRALRHVAMPLAFAGGALGCAAAPAEQTANLAQAREHDTLALGSTATPFRGRDWYTQHVVLSNCGTETTPAACPGNGTATFDGSTFALHAADSWGVKDAQLPAPYADNVQFVYTPIDSAEDLELVIHVTSVSGQDGGLQAGVMLRDTNDSSARIGAAYYSYGGDGGVRSECRSSNPILSSFAHVGRSPYLELGGAVRPYPGLLPVATLLTPPNVYLRLQKVGKDYSVAHSDDGKTWSTLTGGGFQPTSSTALLGFYLANETNAFSGISADATIQIDYIGAPRGVRTGWIGSSFVAESTDYVSRGMQGFYVAPNGTSYKYTFERLDSQQLAHPFNKFANDGTLQQIPYPNAVVTGALQGGITGDGTNIYFARAVCGASADPCSYVIEKRSGTDLSVSLTSSAVPGRIGGMAATNDWLYVSDYDNDEVRVFDTATLSEHTSVAMSLQRPGALAVDSAGRVWVAQNRAGRARYAGGAGPSNDPYTGPGGATDVSVNESFVAMQNFLPDLTICADPNASTCKSSVFCLNPSVAPQSPACPAGKQFEFAGNFNALAIAPAAGSLPEQLLIADNGPNQNIRVCLLDASACTMFGEEGGVFAGPIAGAVSGGSKPRFFSPVGLGVDNSGAVYVASGAPRVQIQKFSSLSATTPDWSVYGLGQDPGAFDPTSDGHDYFSLTRHYSFDPDGLTPAGRPTNTWSPAGVSLDPFLIGLDVQGGTNPKYIPSEDSFRLQPTLTFDAPIIRYIGSQRFMFVLGTDQNQRSVVRIFRFEGEVARPCGRLQFLVSDQVPGAPWVPELWIDKAPFDGKVDPVTELQQLNPADPDYASQPDFGFDVDADGSMWLAFWLQPSPSVANVWKLPATLQDGVPNYSWSTRVVHHIPDTLPLGHGNSVASGEHVRYDVATQSLYLQGQLELQSIPGHESDTATCNKIPYTSTSSADVIVRYDLSTTQSGTTYTLHPGYPAPLPQAPLGPDLPHGPGDPPVVLPTPASLPANACSCSDGTYYGFDIAGDLIFVQSRNWNVHVLSKETGQEVTRLFAGPEGSGNQDVTDRNLGGLRAFVRSNGEYLVTTGDTTGQARTLLFRWWSPEALAPVAWYTADLNFVDLVGQTVSTWRDQSGHHHDVVQTATGYRPEFQAAGLGTAGKPTLAFNGTTSFLRDNGWSLGSPNGGEAEFTVLAVVQPTAVQDGGVASWYATLGGGWVSTRLVPSGSNLLGQTRRQGVNQDNYTFTGATSVGPSGPHVLVYRFKSSSAGGTLSIGVDGTTDTEQVAHAPLSTVMNTEFLIGREDTLFVRDYAGKLSELVVVGRAITDTEVTSYRWYARNKWGTP